MALFHFLNCFITPKLNVSSEKLYSEMTAFLKSTIAQMGSDPTSRYKLTTAVFVIIPHPLTSGVVGAYIIVTCIDLFNLATKLLIYIEKIC